MFIKLYLLLHDKYEQCLDVRFRFASLSSKIQTTTKIPSKHLWYISIFTIKNTESIILLLNIV